MVRQLFTLMICFFSLTLAAQLTNNGATIVIESGATLYVEGAVSNTAGGLITNNGTLEVQGNYSNDATSNLNGSGTSIVIFSGATPSAVSSGTPLTFDFVEMNKSGANVTLSNSVTIADQLTFMATNTGLFELGTQNLNLSDAAGIMGAGSGTGHINASSSGVVSKTVTGNNTFKFEIGDGSSYTPIELTYTGSGYAAASIDANLTSGFAHSNLPSDADDYITRYWKINNSGITGYSATATANYVAGDVVGGDAAALNGASYDGTQPLGSQWSWKSATGTPGSDEISGLLDGASEDFTAMNFFGRANLKVFLQGAYNSGTGLMNTTLNSSGILETHALTSPYDFVTSVGATFFDNNPTIVDWIEIEVRDAAIPSTILSTHSAFLKSDGTILGTDGGSILPLLKDAPSNGIIGINHRNHLGIRMVNEGAVDLDLVSPSQHNFSTGLGQAYDNPGIASNDAMNIASGVYVMWAGNANSNPNVRYNGPANDKSYLLGNILGGNTITVLSGVYNVGDLNLNGVVRYNGPANDKSFLLGQVLGGNTITVINRHL